MQQLVNAGYSEEIRCTLRMSSDTKSLDSCGLKVEKCFGDLNDAAFVAQVMKGVTAVVHIYNIHHSPIIVHEAVSNNVKRVILVHTTGIYSRYKSASAEYKRIEEQIHDLTKRLNYQHAITILRPSMIYGDLCDRNMSAFIRMVDRLRIFPVIEGGKSKIQPIHAKDLGEALYKVLNSPDSTQGKAYEITGERPIELIEALRIISRELGKKTWFVSVPMSIGIAAARVIKGLTFGRADLIEKVQRMAEDRSYEHSAAEADFGFSPIGFEAGIAREVKQYLDLKARKNFSSKIEHGSS